MFDIIEMRVELVLEKYRQVDSARSCRNGGARKVCREQMGKGM